MGTDYLSIYGYDTNFKTAEEVADTMTDVVLELEGAWNEIKDTIEEGDLGLDDKKKNDFINYTQDMRLRYKSLLSTVNDVNSDTLKENQIILCEVLYNLQDGEERFIDMWKTHNVDNIKDGTDEVIHILSDVEGYRFCLMELAYIKLDEEEY